MTRVNAKRREFHGWEYGRSTVLRMFIAGSAKEESEVHVFALTRSASRTGMEAMSKKRRRED